MTYALRFPESAVDPGGEVHALPYPSDPGVLVAGLRRRHPGATATFHQRYVGRISGMLYRLLGPDQDLSDVLQDCFVRILTSIEQLRDPAALDSWVMGVAVLTAKTHLQRRSRGSWLRFWANDELPEQVFEDAEPSVREALRATYRVLSRLSIEERLVFVLRHSEKMTVFDVSSQLGASVSTTKRRLQRAENRFLTFARKEPSLHQWIRAWSSEGQDASPSEPCPSESESSIPQQSRVNVSLRNVEIPGDEGADS